MQMSNHFQQLLDLFQTTHNDLQKRASHSIDVALVVRNWLFGWYLVEYENAGVERAELYGKGLINKLSKELKASGLKGVSPTNLRKFRSFYQAYQVIQQSPPFKSLKHDYVIQQTVSVKSLDLFTGQSPENQKIIQSLPSELFKKFPLGWSHYVTLLSIDNKRERQFYEIEAAENSWSMRELERQIASSLYERLALSRDKESIHKLSEQGEIIEKPADLIKNPLVLEFLDLEERPTYSENELESAIISKLETFLLELGKGFLFEARQKRFTFDNDHFYVDLVFYNRLLQCYVLFDLKRDKLRHQDLGQMQMYVNHFDRYVKTENETPTIGIVLCHQKNDALVELTLPQDANIYASKYQLYLPSKAELKAQLLRIESELQGTQ